MLFAACILSIAIIAIGSAAWAGFRAAPWVPTWQHDAPRILSLLNLQPGETILELGAGDGRLLSAFAKTPAQTIIGFEISLIPYLLGKLRIRRLAPRVQLRYQDLFHADYRGADAIFCFLMPTALAKLKPKFEKECRPGTRIISYTFPIPGWNPVVTDKPNAKLISIYLYQVGAP